MKSGVYNHTKVQPHSVDQFSCLRNTCTGQSERRSPPAPIRTPEWSSCLSGQMRILFTQPRATPEHECHLVISFIRLNFSEYIFPPHLSTFGRRAILFWGIETWQGTVPRPNRIFINAKKRFKKGVLTGFLIKTNVCSTCYIYTPTWKKT